MNSTKLKSLFPEASAAFLRLNSDDGPGTTAVQAGCPGPIAKLEPDSGDGDLGALPIQAAVGRRFLIRVKSYRRRLLDEDNLCEKYHVDLCRYAGALLGDEAGRTKIEVTQEKVGSKEVERVEIEIYELR